MIKVMLRATLGVAASAALTLLPTAHPIAQRLRAAPAVKIIVLVHGAFADGTSWSKVIPLTEADGHHVVAVQIKR